MKKADCKNKAGTLCASLLGADREALAALLHYDVDTLEDAIEALAQLLGV